MVPGVGVAVRKVNPQVCAEVQRTLRKALLTFPLAWGSSMSRTVFLEESFLDHMCQSPGDVG